MSHLYKPSQDTYTSKGRQKVSPYETSFFNTFQYGKETDIWSEKSTNGGSATFNSGISGVVMSVTNQVGSEIIRQTRHVMKYIPGRTSTLTFAIRLDTPVNGIRRRFGLFDDNDGAYFEDGGDGTYYCCIRNSDGLTPTLERIPRSQWNGDKLDGTGVSGIVASPTAQHMINIEYEWYGSGQVIFSYTIDGTPHIIHTFNHANRLQNPWSRTPFLPIRVELTNVTGAPGTHYLYQGSNSLISEGTPEKLGTSENITNSGISTNIVYKTLTNANEFYPMLSIKLKPTDLQGIVLPTFFQTATIDNAGLGYKLIRNATLVGVAFTDHPDPDAFTQFDTSSTSFSGGIVVDSGYVVGGGGGTGVSINEKVGMQLGRVGIGTTMVSDTLTLAVAYMAKSNNAKDAVASLTWIEQR